MNNGVNFIERINRRKKKFYNIYISFYIFFLVGFGALMFDNCKQICDTVEKLME